MGSAAIAPPSLLLMLGEVDWGAGVDWDALESEALARTGRQAQPVQLQNTGPGAPSSCGPPCQAQQQGLAAPPAIAGTTALPGRAEGHGQPLGQAACATRAAPRAPAPHGTAHGQQGGPALTVRQLFAPGCARAAALGPAAQPSVPSVAHAPEARSAGTPSAAGGCPAGVCSGAAGRPIQRQAEWPALPQGQAPANRALADSWPQGVSVWPGEAAPAGAACSARAADPAAEADLAGARHKAGSCAGVARDVPAIWPPATGAGLAV